MATRIPPPNTRLKTVMNANQAFSTTTLADITDLRVGIQANVSYEFRIVLAYSSAATTTGARFVLAGPAFSQLNGRSIVTLTATTFATTHFAAYALPAAAAATSLLTGNLAVIEGIVRFTSNSAFFRPQCASEVNASAITVLAGSFIEMHPLYNT